MKHITILLTFCLQGFSACGSADLVVGETRVFYEEGVTHWSDIEETLTNLQNNLDVNPKVWDMNVFIYPKDHVFEHTPDAACYFQYTIHAIALEDSALEGCLAHEFVHVWQKVEEKPMGHAEEFQEMLPIFEAASRNKFQ